MLSIRGIFSSVVSALQNRAETEQPSMQRLPVATAFNPTGVDAAVRSMLERMSLVDVVAPSRVLNVEANQQNEFKSATTEQIKAIMLPHVQKNEVAQFEQNLEEKTKRLNKAMQEFGITKPLEQVMFLATISHESRGTMAGSETPSKYASSKSDYKGRGEMQLTGAANYRKAATYFQFGDLVEVKNKKGRVISKYYDGFTKSPENRELPAAPEWSSRIAAWFWTKNSVSSKQMGDTPADDLLDFRHASSAVNSGRPDGKVIGWSDRVKTYARALDAFGIEISTDLRKTLDEQQRVGNLSAEGKSHRAHTGQDK